MPRYFFHLHNDVDVLDEEGLNLPDLDSARETALVEARNMAAESVKDGHLTLSHYVAVTDENGETLFRTSFQEAVRIDG
ncbi:MAG TPA: hypothetical protein VFS49_11470 [Croceibacterium sp.]|nr:hypothetical protein [Croceibacterium sp.]